MKWEYRYEVDASTADLNGLGLEGWEAASMTPGTEESYPVVLMKRPLPDPDAVKIEASARYGIFLNASPHSSGWLKDSSGYVMSSASRMVMEAQASELDASWGAEVRAVP